MNDPLSGPDKPDATAFSQASMRAIMTWLGAPPPENPIDQLMPLHCHLAALRASDVSPQQRNAVIDSLFHRVISVVSTLTPTLTIVSLPPPRKSRQLIRGLQDLLRAIAEDLLATLTRSDEVADPSQPTANALILWRSLYALSLHLLISNLTASPPGVGIWRQLHQTFEIARRTGIARSTPRKAPNSLQDVYYSAVLIGCAQPASFSSQEVKFIAAYLELFADQIDADTDPKSPFAFWIDPEQDSGATACCRKPAPPDTPVHYFSCTRLAKRLKKHLAALTSGVSAKEAGLPPFADTSAGQGVLRRLINHWGDPGKRRYTRRRQNHRATVFTGLGNLWKALQGQDEILFDASVWMVTNESPDGYSVMHLSGKPGQVFVGDISAIRIEPEGQWQIGIIRWALSENQEHLELGLQILAIHATPASIPVHKQDQPPQRLPALLLPEAPPLRSNEMLVTPSGALDNHPENLVLLIEKENFEIREVPCITLAEQNSLIDIYTMPPLQDTA